MIRIPSGNKHVLMASRRGKRAPHKSGHNVIYFISQILGKKNIKNVKKKTNKKKVGKMNLKSGI